MNYEGQYILPDGSLTDAPFHAQILKSNKGNLAADILAIRQAIENGIDENVAIKLFAGEESRVWIEQNGLKFP